MNTWLGTRLNNLYFRSLLWSRRNAAIIEILAWLLLAAITAVSLPHFQRWLAPNIDKHFLDSLQTLALTISGAMIGATAIAASFVLFAMQVNVERLPHGLFHRFSSDPQLLSTFGASFIVAIGGTALSLISDERYAALLITLEVASAAIVLRLLLLAYRRSFELVNPAEQLQIIYRVADRQLRRINNHIDRVTSSVEDTSKEMIDEPRREILYANPGWDRLLRDTIKHSIAYARRGGEHGDLEISGTALSFVIALNARYVQTKGRTFFANNILIQNPLVTDGTINSTLEDLRRLSETALVRRDEPQLEQVFATFAGLIKVYLQIDYGLGQSKSHALLAAGYLKRSIDATVTEDLIDTTMNGIRTLGKVGLMLLENGDPDESTDCISQIGMLGMVGAVSEKHRPLTLAAMEELRDLTIALFRVEDGDIKFAVRQLRDSITAVAIASLETRDMPLSSSHSFYLSPYFSSTSYTSLRHLLTHLVNTLVRIEHVEAGERIADHLAVWSEEIYAQQKKLVLASIEKQSQFSFDVIHWVTGITELLIAASRAPHTRKFARNKLEKNALWLFRTLSWIPSDQDTARFVENLSYRSEVFEMALKARRFDWPEGFDAAWNLAMKWALSAGKFHTGWGTLERWLSALCALSLWGEIDQSRRLKDDLVDQISKPDAPDQKMRDQAARGLRELALNIRQHDYEMDLVKRILASNDRRKTRKILRDVAYILSPATVYEPVQINWF